MNSLQPSRSFFQARAHQVFDRRLRAEHALRVADGVVRVNLLETERHQRQHGVVNFLVVRRQRPLCARRLPRARRADFVAQLDDDALGGFFADAGNLRECLHVAASHRAAKCRHADAAQNIQRRFRSDAADTVDEQAEQIAFRRARKAVKNVRVLADNQLCEQFHRAARLRQLVKRRQRNERFVTNTVDIHDDLRGQRLDEFALEKSNHYSIQKPTPPLSSCILGLNSFARFSSASDCFFKSAICSSVKRSSFGNGFSQTPHILFLRL